MLNIPESVKALFKADGIRKNFRVHFPNGELPDITNDNIVQESVQFTESLCSQDVLKFGLTEASVLEFETVGVANMYGMTIEAGIEIDLSSLSAAEIAEIAAGSWDGIYVPESAVFRVPYGVFQVESCPRDHQAMTHRKVTAYTFSAHKLFMNPFEEAKLKVFYPGDAYKPNLYYLMLSLLGWKDNSIILDEGFLEGAALSQTSSSNPISKTITLSKIGGGTIDLTSNINQNIGYHHTSGSQTSYTVQMKELYSLHKNYLTDENISLLFDEIAEALENLGTIDLAGSGYDSWLELAKDFCTDDDGNITLHPSFRYAVYYQSGTNTYTATATICHYFTEENKAIYPLADLTTYGSGQQPSSSGGSSYWGVAFDRVLGTFRLPYSMNIRQGTTNIYSKSWSSDIPTVKKYERAEAIPNYQLSFASTLQTVMGLSTLYSFANSYSVGDIIGGWLELHAKFGKAARNGNTEVYEISTDSPISVIPGEYMGFWWDEYDIDSVGSVKYTFQNEKNEQCDGVYEFGTGLSVYDMSGNPTLEAIVGINEEIINEFLTGSFVPNLNPITFTPIDMEMKGLPYLEAGDYLAIAAEDGTIVNSFIMRMEISGIQMLTATIQSEGGEIIRGDA